MHKKREAAALSYDSALQGAPLVVAKGEGAIAEEIIRKAEENGIPVMQNPALLPFLMQSNLMEEIPAGLYGAVAVIFKKLMEIDGKLASTSRGKS